MYRTLRALVVPLLLAAAGGALGQASLRTGTFDPPRAAPDFSLQGSDGAEFRLSRHRGKVVALGFGYTSCPDVCPTTLAELAQARKLLGAAGKDFQVVWVTVDPERDSAERMRHYVTAFDPSFIGATGAPAQLETVRKAYGIQVARKESSRDPATYYVHHSSFVYFIDRAGMLRAMMPFGGRTVDDIAHDVKQLLKN